MSFAFLGKSQVELKINPLTFFFGSLDVSLEYGVKPNFGIDIAPSINFDNKDLGGIEYKGSGFGAVINPRYYFNPSKGINKFYVGAYANFVSRQYKDNNDVVGWKNTRFALGPNIGYKTVSKSGLLFDIGFGFGRSFYNENTSEEGLDISELSTVNSDFIGKLAIGYRF